MPVYEQGYEAYTGPRSPLGRRWLPLFREEVLRKGGEIRKAQPYSMYEKFDFEIPIGANGDSNDWPSMKQPQGFQSR